MENRHGLVVDACVVPATGTAERDAAMSLVASLPRRRVTIGGTRDTTLTASWRHCANWKDTAHRAEADESHA